MTISISDSLGNISDIPCVELEDIIKLLRGWSTAPELKYIDFKVEGVEFKLKPKLGICGNLTSFITLESIRKNYNITDYGLVNASNILFSLGIDVTEWDECNIDIKTGKRDKIFPIGGKVEYGSTFYSNFWKLDSNGKRRRKFCSWLADKLEEKL